MYKKAVSFILVLFFLIVFASSVEAHPGRTAADGCHYCRTNCDSWGVPWNERHCHGGGVPPVQSSEQPPIVQSTEVPTRTPTRTPPSPTKYQETAMDKKKMFKVVEVVDGDTIKVNVRGKIESVRLLAIDTPETKDPRKPVQCFGNEATKKMSSFVAGKFVKLVDDRSQGNRDKYSRLLRYIYLQDGTFVNAEMVKQGYAFSYKQYPTRFLEQFNKYERQAREKNLGLWGSCPIK